MRITMTGRLLFLIATLTLASCGGRTLSKAVDHIVFLNPADFVAVVDNPFFPLVPGTVYRFAAASEGETQEVAILPEKKRILGIDATIVHDRVWKGNKLKEETFDWYAQDKQGNVWYLGEDTRAHLPLGITWRAGSWEAGKNGAQAGIIMKAAPVVGEEYRQEYYAGKAEDMGKVLSLDEVVTVPYGSFQGCWKTEDWTPLEKSDVEHKYYCRGIGLVLEMNAKKPSERNELTALKRP
jgi:hypothetical protein